MALILSTLICPWRRKRNRKLAHNGKFTNTTDLLTLSVSFTEREEQNLQIRLLCGSVVCFNVASSLNKMETAVYEPHMVSFFYFNSLSSWKWTSPEGLGGLFYTCGNSWGVGGEGGDIGFLWKWKIQEGGGGPKWNSLCGGGLDIFWNYTIENSLCYMDFSKKLSRILPTPLMFKSGYANTGKSLLLLVKYNFSKEKNCKPFFMALIKREIFTRHKGLYTYILAHTISSC